MPLPLCATEIQAAKLSSASLEVVLDASNQNDRRPHAASNRKRLAVHRLKNVIASRYTLASAAYVI